jgi:hypothetical protein
VIFISYAAFANENTIETKEDFVDHFIETAFTYRQWNEDADNRLGTSYAKVSKMIKDKADEYNLKFETAQKKYKSKKREMPWIADHIYFPEGKANRTAVHRWESRAISIGFGWPAYTEMINIQELRAKHPDRIRQSPYNDNNIEEFIPILLQVLDEFIPKVETAINKPINVIMPGDMADKSPAYARIRIVPVSGILQNRTHNRDPKYHSHPLHSELYFLGGILFESSNNKMDGYLLPGANNALDLAVCKIDSSLPEDIFKNYVRECVYRSLGMPPDMGYGRSSGAFTEIGDYELALLKLLYCHSLNSGMNQNTVEKMLLSMESQSCY